MQIKSLLNVRTDMDVTYIELELPVYMTNRCNKIFNKRTTRARGPKKDILSHYLWASAKFWFPFYANKFFFLLQILRIRCFFQWVYKIKLQWQSSFASCELLQSKHFSPFFLNWLKYSSLGYLLDEMMRKIIFHSISINHFHYFGNVVFLSDSIILCINSRAQFLL